MKRRMPFFGSLLRIHSINPNDQRIEYMFRVTLLTMTISALLFTIVSVMGLILGFVPVDTPGILITMDILFLIGWLLSRARRWRLARFIPLGIIYLIALYGNFIGGIEAPAMLLYVLAMTFASTLFGRGILSGVTVLCLLSYLTISLLQYFGIITPLRTAESVFLNRIMVAFFSMLGVGILLGFLLTLIEKALALSRERETELEIRDTKYTTLFNALADGVLILDSTGRIEEVNRAASIQTGFRRSEMVEMGFIGLSCCAEADLRKIDEVIRNRSAVRFETSLKRKGGELFPVEAAVTASDIGENVKAICVIRDITERKAVEKDKERVQQQLIQAQKMEAVGTLASGIAHDFNNMLGGITGSLSLMEILLDKEGTPRDNRLFSHLETALKSSERAAGITRQLLMLSRKSEQKYLPTDLSIPLRNVITLCRNSFPKTIDFDVHIDTEPMRVLADPIQIEQVVLNLCVNASHAMTIMRNAEERQGGTLSLTTGRVSVDEAFIRDHPSASPGQHYYDIAVSDTGVGMDEETKRRIFDPFFTLKGKNEGTGLAPFHDFESQVPQELKDQLEQIRQGIIDGSIEVTSPNQPTDSAS